MVDDNVLIVVVGLVVVVVITDEVIAFPVIVRVPTINPLVLS